MAETIDWGFINDALRARALKERADAARMAEQEKARLRATQFEGMREYEQLVQSGAKPEEALRRTAHKIYIGSPAQFGRAVTSTGTTPAPYVTNFPNIPNQPFVVNTDRYGAQRATRIPTPTMTPDVAAQQKLREQEIASIRRQIEDPLNMGRRGELSNALKQAESAYVQGSTNRPAAAAPQAQEVIRVTRDGRRAVFDAETKRFLRYAE